MSIAMPASKARSASDTAPAGEGLADPELRRFLLEYVKKRVPKADADDVVQTVLLDALASSKRPEDPAELRKWVVGIARHKCADVHRRAGRERPADDDLPEQPAAPSPIEERSLVRWAEEQAQSSREAGKTLDWMAREGEGDKLEHIAEEEALPPARVRQRVSRMRRFLKERWLAEVALVAALGAIAFVVWAWLRKDDEPIVADPTKPPPSSKAPDQPELERVVQGRKLRVGALEICRSGDDQRCLDDLDRAKELDPAGDEVPEVREARERAAENLRRKEAPQQNDAKSPAPGPTTSLDDESLQKSTMTKSKANELEKSAPKAPQTSSPKAPPKPRSKKELFDGDSKAAPSDLDSDPSPPPATPSAAPPPVAPPVLTAPPSKEPPSKSPVKGAKSSGKPQAPTFNPPPSQAAPPQQMQMKK